MPNPELPPKPAPAEVASKTPESLALLVVPLQKFSMGRMVVTSNALASLALEDINLGLVRHSRCDWGDVCEEDRKVNERGVLEEGMILSSYQSAKGVRFWVITDPGHEVTTVLLPEDY